VAAALAAATGCRVDDRADLVGRYTADTGGRHEEWQLSADGTCTIVRRTADAAEATARCEWQWIERDGTRRLVVTLRPPPGGSTSHQTRYVLAPSRVPGGPVTLPLGPDGPELRKVE
jgi:hypothetical protein